MVQQLQLLEMEPFEDEFENELNRASQELQSNGKTKSNSGSGGDILDCVTQDGYFHKLSPRSCSILGAVGFILLCLIMYTMNAETAEDEVIQDSITKNTTINKYTGQNNTALDDSPTNSGEPRVHRDNGLHEGLFSNYPIISIHDDGVQSSPVETPVVGDGGVCPALCESREKARNTKFGGDLLDLSDVLKMANKAHDKLIDYVRPGYGQYFDGIFITQNNGRRQYAGMQPVTTDGASRKRLKRKLQLKVLKMMEALKLSEENIHGCNCRTKTGSTTESEETFTSTIPDYYQKYVFANGGHSNAAGHGNIFKETYTHYIGEDLKIIWDAIGVEMVSRNMAMGAMRSSPDIATCSKEIFGIDVDLLTWNYAMTDKSFESHLHYMYRGAVNPGRPAMISMDIGLYEKWAGPLEELGLAMFRLFGGQVSTIANVPDSAPDQIPLTDNELNKLPPMVKSLKCGRRLESDPCSPDAKWSCTKSAQKAGINCTCPELYKRNGWHMGFKMHALEAHFITLPLVEMLLEGLSELVESKKDPKTLFQELQKEEDKEFEAFLSVPVLDKFNDEGFMERFGALGDEIDTWFKGPSLCRTSLLPSMTRYLGLALNSNKVGGAARCGEEEYETGYFFDRANGKYTYTDRPPPDGEIVILSPNDARYCYPTKICSEIVMPDHKDWFYGDWTNGPISITFPNEKEREYFGYKRGKFKGILGLVSTVFTENVKSNRYDIASDEWIKYVDAKVNGKPVTNWKHFNRMAILEGADGIYWEPSANNDYTLEFSPKGTLGDGRPSSVLHFRLQGFVLY